MKFNCFLVEKCAACQSHRKSDFGWIAFFLTTPCLMRSIKRVQKSLKWFWWPSRAASWLVSLSYYCIWCVFFFWFPKVERSFCAYFMQDNDLTYNSIRFDITLQIFKKSSHFSDHKYKDNVPKNTMYLVMLCIGNHMISSAIWNK